VGGRSSVSKIALRVYLRERKKLKSRYKLKFLRALSLKEPRPLIDFEGKAFLKSLIKTSYSIGKMFYKVSTIATKGHYYKACFNVIVM